MKGVKLFNNRMLSRWREEGFLDFAALTTTTKPIRSGVPSAIPRQGHAVEILWRMLGLKNSETEDQEEAGSTRRGDGTESSSEVSAEEEVVAPALGMTVGPLVASMYG